MSVSTTISITHDSKIEIMSLIICKFNTTHISIIKIMLNIIHVSEDHGIFFRHFLTFICCKMRDFNSDLEHYMYSYDNFAWNKFATAFIEKKQTNLEVFYIVHYDAGLRFNFFSTGEISLQNCKNIFNIKILFQVFLSNTKMNKYT